MFYLDWLLDHRGEFELLGMRKLGREVSESIDRSNPRLVCVARDFNRYDEHAVAQMNRSIELVRYRDYQGELLALELLTVVSGTPVVENGSAKRVAAAKDKTVLVCVKVDPDGVELVEGFTRDVRAIGHFGTGDPEIRIRTSADLVRATDLLQHSYNAS